MNSKIVLATGCFDILHVGHVRLLEEAATHGALWVGLNSDRAVRLLKGERRPLNLFESRAAVIAALACVEKVFEIDDIRVANTIRNLQPGFWVKGGDYTLESLDPGEVAAAKEVGTQIVLVPSFGGYSTTKLIERMGK